MSRGVVSSSSQLGSSDFRWGGSRVSYEERVARREIYPRGVEVVEQSGKRYSGPVGCEKEEGAHAEAFDSLAAASAWRRSSEEINVTRLSLPSSQLSSSSPDRGAAASTNAR